MERPQFLSNLLTWLRAGYPDGIPYSDYPPLLVLLRRQRLTEDEVVYVADRLIDDGVVTSAGPRPVSKIDAQVGITKITDEMPDEEDVRRVAEHLAGHGWPFDPYPLGPPPASA